MRCLQMATPEDLCHYFADVPGRAEPRARLASYTSFRIGGAADLLLFPRDVAALRQTRELAQRYDAPFFTLGAGTNLLVSDAGVRGVVVSLKDGFQEIETLDALETGEAHGSVNGAAESNSLVIRAEAGVKQSRLARYAARQGLSGAEFMIGIPGTVGGAVRMNAGTRRSSTSEILLDAEVLQPDGRLTTMTHADLQFGYRTSALAEGAIVVAARFRLRKDDPAAIAARMADDTAHRKASQPLSRRSAGSFFMNPPGSSAGWLIENAGLKGAAEGDARVSRKHANFLINAGEARARDVVALMRRIQSTVAAHGNVSLNPEVKMVGENHPARHNEEEETP